jgi:hypothetical protein
MPSPCTVCAHADRTRFHPRTSPQQMANSAALPTSRCRDGRGEAS